MTPSDTTLIAPHTHIKGELTLEGPTVIGGRIEGTITAMDALEIAPEGIIDGDIHGVLVDIQGTVKGNVIATQACRLGATARVTGELRAANLAIAEGASFIGHVHVGGMSVQEEDVVEAISAAQTVSGTIHRLESLAMETDELAHSAAEAAAMSNVGVMPGVAAMAAPAISFTAAGPAVRVMPQPAPQTVHRSPKIIKAR